MLLMAPRKLLGLEVFTCLQNSLNPANSDLYLSRSSENSVTKRNSRLQKTVEDVLSWERYKVLVGWNYAFSRRERNKTADIIYSTNSYYKIWNGSLIDRLLGTKSEISGLSSNPSRVCSIHICRDSLWKSVNPYNLPPSPVMG